MIIGRDLMVQLGMTAKFKRQVLQWYVINVHMKESRNLLGQSDLTKREICEIVMQTEEPDSTLEATDIMVKNLDSAYTKAYLKQVVNANQLNAEERTLLLILLEDFEDFFDETLVNWTTEHVDLELQPDSKLFNSRYYLSLESTKKHFKRRLIA